MALRLLLRSERASPVPPEYSAIPAARRLIAPRARTAIMMPKASTAADRNTSSDSISAELSSSIPVITSSMPAPRSPDSNLKVHQPVHDQVSEAHPAGGHREPRLGHAFIPHPGVEVGCNDLNDQEQADRQ